MVNPASSGRAHCPSSGKPSLREDSAGAPRLQEVEGSCDTPAPVMWPLPRRRGPAAKMATYLQWRRFVFFDKELVKEPQGNDGAAPGAAPASGPATSKFLCLPPGITVCDSGRGSLVFGDILLLELSLSSSNPWRDPAEMKSVRQKGSCYVPVSFRWALGVPSVVWGKKGGSPFSLTCCQMSEQSWASRLTSLDFNFLICKRGVK